MCDFFKNLMKHFITESESESKSKQKISKKEFLDYYDLIIVDILREIDSAKTEENSGNFMVALALLEYTSYVGLAIMQQTNTREHCPFKVGFESFHPSYKNLFDEICLVRSMIVKGPFETSKTNVYISMLHRSTRVNSEPVGFWKSDDGSLNFCVETYFNEMDKCINLMTNEMQ